MILLVNHFATLA